jgi:hypothetical protein
MISLPVCTLAFYGKEFFMGYNRSGARRTARMKRQKRHDARLARKGGAEKTAPGAKKS